MRVLVFALALAAAPAMAQVYRWVDDKGTVHYSNTTPPPGVKAIVVDPDAKPGPPSPESLECNTIRCQGERLEQRLARREQIEARLAAERAAAAPPPPRGMDFRVYMRLERGMSEGELLTRAGAPDVVFWDPFHAKNYTYLPTSADPFTTTIWVVGGQITRLDRVRKF